MLDSPVAGTLTERNARRTRDDLLSAATELLMRGAEPTMRAVAAEAGVGERTIYRYFPNREALESEMREHLRSRLGAPLCGSTDELEGYVEELFDVFEENYDLTVAMVSSPWTQTSLAGSRAQNLEDLHALLTRGFPRADPVQLRSAAATLRTVLSGAGWVYQATRLRAVRRGGARQRHLDGRPGSAALGEP
ncbi:MAG: helix-turn-helix domain-containing protein [Microthrixaceae bacterium]